MQKQITLNNSVSCVGTGLHSGAPVRMVISPSAANTGIIFKRIDVAAKQGFIPARYDLVSETRLGTTLRNAHGVTISTIEHLMAAIWGMGIDNALIELDGPEVPIMDGSSEPFMFLLECAGTKKLSAPRRILKLLKTIEVRDGESVARVSPNLEGEEGCLLNVEISFDDEVIRNQKASYDFRDITFKQSLSRARTFGFEHEVEALRSAGLALGGSLDNAVVIGKEGVLNKEGLRYNDEFVRHKALDCLGDLYLAGLRIDGKFDFTRPGHTVNNALLHAIFADDTAYMITHAGKLEQPVFSRQPQQVPAYA